MTNRITDERLKELRQRIVHSSLFSRYEDYRDWLDALDELIERRAAMSVDRITRVLNESRCLSERTVGNQELAARIVSTFAAPGAEAAAPVGYTSSGSIVENADEAFCFPVYAPVDGDSRVYQDDGAPPVVDHELPSHEQQAGLSVAHAPQTQADENQCDGCARGLPLSGGLHRADGEWPTTCTAHLYGAQPEAPAVPAKVVPGCPTP